jgi:FKBP-type peptidyl-prolyl cis-trans isomerase FklB
MKTFLFRTFGWLTIVLFALTSCEEHNPYTSTEDWQKDNEAFILDIHKKATNTEQAQWEYYKAWTLIPDGSYSTPSNPQQYIYVKVLKRGTGTVSPAYTDSVDVNYRGKFYNGNVFDQSYDIDEPDRNIVNPAGFRVNQLVVGFSTALQNMHEGDRWLVYIPWSLGYGESGSSSIAGYSNLIFDIDLVKITQ